MELSCSVSTMERSFLSPGDSTTDKPQGSCESLPIRPCCILESCAEDTGENHSQHILSAQGPERHVCSRMKKQFDVNLLVPQGTFCNCSLRECLGKYHGQEPPENPLLRVCGILVWRLATCRVTWDLVSVMLLRQIYIKYDLIGVGWTLMLDYAGVFAKSKTVWDPHCQQRCQFDLDPGAPSGGHQTLQDEPSCWLFPQVKRTLPR